MLYLAGISFRAHRTICAAALAALILPQASHAQSPAEFFRGKTFTFVSGFTPSGEFDTYFRTLGRHMGQYIPGNPQMQHTNLPGAGTLTAANHMANRATPDGLTIGAFTAHAAIEPFMGNRSAIFDPRKFGFIGTMTQDLQFCAVVPGPGVPLTVKELTEREAVFGTSSPASDTYRHLAVVRNVLGLKVRVVSGYAGMPAINLALQRGEVGGVCGHTPMSLRTRFADDLAQGRLKLLVQMGAKTTKEFGDVPSIFDFPVSPENQAILDFYFRAMTVGHPIVAPPGVPAQRLDAIRTAFLATLKDSEFVAEARKLNLAVDPSTALEVERQIAKIGSFTPEFIARLKKAAE